MHRRRGASAGTGAGAGAGGGKHILPKSLTYFPPVIFDSFCITFHGFSINLHHITPFS